jgi:hypothetical protein
VFAPWKRDPATTLKTVSLDVSVYEVMLERKVLEEGDAIRHV